MELPSKEQLAAAYCDIEAFDHADAPTEGDLVGLRRQLVLITGVDMSWLSLHCLRNGFVRARKANAIRLEIEKRATKSRR